MKGDESQINPDQPCILIADFTHFGGPAVSKLIDPHQTTPLIRGHKGLCSGAMWHGVYGWKRAPVFEEILIEPKRMGHDGRFRLTGKNLSRLSAVLFVFHKGVVLLENGRVTARIAPQPVSGRLTGDQPVRISIFRDNIRGSNLVDDSAGP